MGRRASAPLKPPRGLVLDALRELAETPHKPIVWGSAKRGWRVGPLHKVDGRAVRRLIREGWVKPLDARWDGEEMIERYSFTPAGRRAYTAAQRASS
ncbi:MAG: hypothetical protein ACRC67_22670 [Inquilinus sp.]|uniref:hypothetical protein n=1 Tax=Inquilinus sp. TaxID=1932117 RepID=UPI003F340642